MTSARRNQIPESERDYYLERRYPSFGNLVPRDVASRNAKAVCDEGRGVGETGLGVYLDFSDAIQRLGADVIRERYGNLFEMYQRITDEDPYQVPMRIYPAIHYTMGGLWVDYYLMSTIPGLFVIGEANFSDHGANRLGASALMQGLVGRLLHPAVHGGRLHRAERSWRRSTQAHAEFRRAPSIGVAELTKTAACDPRPSHRGRVPSPARQDRLGLLRHVARRPRGWRRRLAKFASCASSFGRTSTFPAAADDLNQSLEKAGRVADFFELAELMCLDALDRGESCGGHFREEYQTPDGEAQRNDEECSYVGGVGIPGTGPARRRCTRSRSSSNTCIPASGATSNAAGSARLASEEPGITRAAMVRYEANDVNPDMSMLELLDVVNEEPDLKGRGADRIRARLPRGDLRIVRVHDQRHCARAAARHHGVPAHHAAFQGRRRSCISSRGAPRRFR